MLACHPAVQVNNERNAICDAATALLHLSSLAAGSQQSPSPGRALASLQAVERAQELAWLLCDALGIAQALLERHGRFVQVQGGQLLAWLLCEVIRASASSSLCSCCAATAAAAAVEGAMRQLWQLLLYPFTPAFSHPCPEYLQACLWELQAQLRQLAALALQPARAAAGAAAATEEGAPDAQELQDALTAGLQHCLLWLYGLELPGLDKQEEWGGGFEVRARPAFLRAAGKKSPECIARCEARGVLGFPF